MEYFAGLDVRLEKTDICVLDRERTVVHEAAASSLRDVIATALTATPACTRVPKPSITGMSGSLWKPPGVRFWVDGLQP